jgi:hypothetical protein
MVERQSLSITGISSSDSIAHSELTCGTRHALAVSWCHKEGQEHQERSHDTAPTGSSAHYSCLDMSALVEEGNPGGACVGSHEGGWLMVFRCLHASAPNSSTPTRPEAIHGVLKMDVYLLCDSVYLPWESLAQSAVVCEAADRLGRGQDKLSAHAKQARGGAKRTKGAQMHPTE